MAYLLLELTGITKRFFGVPALRGVSLDLRRQEIHALVGENGAGKSTLMKILSGVYPCSDYEGRVVIDGSERRFCDPHDAEAAGIEMIYQELSLHLDLTIAENIFLGKLPTTRRGLVDWSRMYREADAALAQVNLPVSPKTILRQLSASQQQLVAIAKALTRKPGILILDEPTSVLTEPETDNLFGLLAKLKGSGVSCIYITHRLNEVMRIADRVTVLRDGENVSTFERADMNADKIVEDMVGRRIETMYPKPPIGAESSSVGARFAVASQEEVLRVEHVSIPHPYTPRKNIIDDVSFCLRKGEILGLGGLVGAGRSELVKAVFGATGHDGRARVFLEGKPLEISGPGDAIDAGIALLTEDRKKDGYVGTMDIRCNMSLASLAQVSRRSLMDFRKERALGEQLMQRLSVKATGIDASVLSLSGGNQQKVVLAKWLTKPLKVLILDEPTRGIDVGAKVQIYRLMTELAGSGVGIMMISSELPELLSMCDRHIVLANGRIVDEFDRANASPERLLRAATGAYEAA